MKLTDESIKGMRAFTKGIQDKALGAMLEGRAEMKIEDCKTVYEYLGVGIGECIYVEGKKCQVWEDKISVVDATSDRYQTDGRVLVGCLTGQLKWSKHEPMTAEEEKILREIAAWFPWWSKINLDGDAVIRFHDNTFMNYPFGSPFSVEGMSISKAYEVLAPILEKYGEINLDDCRESN